MCPVFYVLFLSLLISVVSALPLSSVKNGAFLELQRTAALNRTVKPDNVYYNILEEKHIEFKKSAKCMCPKGKFWHWRIKQCIPQGQWGYECGFFPREHWHRVCQDGYVCKRLKSKAEYHHDGAGPATCQHCQPEDNCLYGDERQKKECLAEYELSGEACAKVEVVKEGISATAGSTQSHTTEVKQTAEAEAHAKAREKEEATATVKETWTADGKDTETVKETTVIDPSDPSRWAKPAKVKGHGEGTATAETTAKATAEATAKGTGEATASGTATESAEGSAKATRKATVTTKLPPQEGKAIEESCVSVDEAKKSLGLENKKVGAVLGAKIVSEADKMAFERSYEKALQKAAEVGLADAKKLAKELARSKAEKYAKMKAESAAKEKAAWEAEANAYKMAKLSARKAAEENASAEAEEKATAEATVKAEKLAKKKAQVKAEKESKMSAEKAAKRKAEEKAKKKANEDAERKAKAERKSKAPEKIVKKEAYERSEKKAHKRISEVIHPPDEEDTHDREPHF